MIRAVILFLMLIAVSYGLMWWVTSTDYFKDKDHVRGIIKKVTMTAVAIIIAVAIFSSIFFVEHQI